MAHPRVVLSIVLGGVMIGLGLMIIVRLLARGGQPLSPAPWLDVLFAAFFLIRGAMHLRTIAALRR